jgi:GMP synthase (glutamine-hydrolysing)
MRGVTDQQPILIVLHQETSSPGRVGKVLEARGFPLDIRRPPLGDDLPETLEHHSGAVVFGGPMSANDDHDYVRRETDWLAVPLAENKPLLGICLGAQMLVNHLGGEVKEHPDGLVEIGWYPIRPTEEGERLMAWPSMIYQFHREGFSLPDGAVRLVTGDSYENQAFRYGENAWAVQFHAELTQVMMHRWAVRGAHRFHLPGAQDGQQHIRGRLLYDRPVFAWLNDFIDMVFLRSQKQRSAA